MTTTERTLKLHSDATQRYNERFRNDLYLAATEGRDSDYCIALMDSAMALCGSPIHTFDNSRWDNDGLAKTFLSCFLGANSEVQS